MCTKQLAQSLSQNSFVLQKLDQTKLSHSEPAYYFELQSFLEATARFTLYYKDCKKLVPVSCDSRISVQNYFVQKKLTNRARYYLVVQSMQNAGQSNDLPSKAFMKQVPVLLCATKLAHRPFQTSLNYKACTKQVPLYFHYNA